MRRAIRAGCTDIVLYIDLYVLGLRECAHFRVAPVLLPLKVFPVFARAPPVT